MHLLFCAHFIFCSNFLRVFNLDIFSIINAKGVPSLCNLKLQQYSILYIQIFHNDCSHIEDVHLLFCAHFIFCSNFLRVFNLDVFSFRDAQGVPSLCKLYLQQYSLLYIQTLHDDCSHIEDVTLPFCAHLINIFLFLTGLELRHFSFRDAKGVPSLCNQ